MERGPHDSDGPSRSLAVRDSATGTSLDLPIIDNAIRAADFTRIAPLDDPTNGLLSYDPAFLNTASCRSAITFIDGDRGILRYRGYPIEQLAERLPFLDVAYLLVHGELPTAEASARWATAVAAGGDLPRPIMDLVATFPNDAHPMTVLLAAWSALAAYRPATHAPDDPAIRDAETPAFLGLIASVVGLVVRHRTGRPLAPGPSATSLRSRAEC